MAFKLPFLKKKEEEFGDLNDFSNLGNLGLDNKDFSAPTAALGAQNNQQWSMTPDPLQDRSTQPQQAQSQSSSFPSDPSLAFPQASVSTGANPQMQTASPSPFSTPQQSPSTAQPQAFSQQQQSQQQFNQPYQQQYAQQLQHAPLQSSGIDSKDMELINAKLDAIRSSLETISHRLARLEQLAVPQAQQKYAW